MTPAGGGHDRIDALVEVIQAVLGSLEGRSAADAWDAAVSAAKRQPVGKEEVPALIDRGFALEQKRRYDEAREAWRAALEVDPGNRMLELNLRKLEAMKERKP